MKILQINANYGLGSTGLIMRDIGDAIVDSGHEAYYAFQKCSEVPLNAYIIGNTLDWKLHAFEILLLKIGRLRMRFYIVYVVWQLLAVVIGLLKRLKKVFWETVLFRVFIMV